MEQGFWRHDSLLKFWKGKKKVKVSTDSFGFNVRLPDKTKTDDFQKMQQNFGVKKKNVNIMVLKNAFPVLWEYFACMICSCINVYTRFSHLATWNVIYSVECATKSPTNVLSPQEGANFGKFFQTHIKLILLANLLADCFGCWWFVSPSAVADWLCGVLITLPLSRRFPSVCTYGL